LFEAKLSRIHIRKLEKFIYEYEEEGDIKKLNEQKDNIINLNYAMENHKESRSGISLNLL